MISGMNGFYPNACPTKTDAFYTICSLSLIAFSLHVRVVCVNLINGANKNTNVPN